ncbi:hypothetical protein [Burkholderia multivorans]|nr:hypothetical protein [Burkholderia multivorans]
MEIRQAENGRYLTTNAAGQTYVSDEHGEPLRDEEGFVTYVGNFGL